MGRHSLQNCPSQVPMGDLDPRLIHGSLGPQAHKSPRHKWHLDHFSRFCRVHSCNRPTDRLNLSSPLATTDMGRKLGAVPLLGGAGCPSNTMWLGLRPTSMPSFIFTARRYASAVLAVVVCPSVCLSVRLSVCLSQAGIVSKRQHIESRKQRRTVAQGI